VTTVGWGQVQDAIKKVIVETGAVAANAVAWEGEQRPTAKIPIVIKIIYADAILNRDTFELGTIPTATWSLSTLYYIRVQVRAEAIYNAPGANALFAIEKVRAGLQRPGLTPDAGVIVQPDDQTYVHNFDFTFDGRTISCWTIETGFRAVIDFPLDGPEDTGANMVEVDVDTGVVDVGETDPEEIAAVILRP
jgi:hypothetical protein